MNAYIKTGLPPGPKARSRGTKMDRGKATQVMIYPRLKTKDVFVKKANASGQRMSGFIILNALQNIARQEGCGVEDLIPKNEFEELQRVRGRSTADWSEVKVKTKAGKA